MKSVLATIWPTAIPEYAAYGPDKVDLRARIQEIREGFQWATPEFPRNNGFAYTLPFPEEVSQTEWITQHALAFIRETDPAQPLYAHISYVQPHSPFHPPGETMQYVDTSRIPAPAPAEWVDDPHAPGYFADKEPVDMDWALRPALLLCGHGPPGRPTGQGAGRAGRDGAAGEHLPHFPLGPRRAAVRPRLSRQGRAAL